MNLRILFCLFSCFIISFLNAQNLIPNGDFEQGNGIGFQSAYNYINPGAGQANSTPRQYAVINNSNLLNTTNFVSSTDHTTGTGLMMVCDGASSQSEVFWSTNGDITLQAGETYRFSFFIRSVNNTNPQPEIGFRVMAAAATYFNASYVVTNPSTGWQEVSFNYTVSEPGAPNRRFELYNVNQSAVGNDFAIDDISLRRLVPLSMGHLVLNATCFGVNDGSISMYAQGGTGPYNYSITGPVNQSNSTGFFTALPAGTYTISVTDSASETIITNNVVVTQPANTLTISPANRMVCSGIPITLTASGGGNYNWTSSPVDPSLINPANAAVTVSPTETTIYTVTSTQPVVRNLVFNGDFSQGNIGFATDYQYLNPVDPVGVQGAYAVVPNAQVWFAGFESCTDHTNGTGNMMVVDGSVANGGNDRVWCQTVPVNNGRTYTFSYWVQSVALPNPANLEVLINGVSLAPAEIAPSTTCDWVEYTYTWTNGSNTTVEICIYNRTTTAAGNDFALDDISFTETIDCVLTRSVTLTVPSVTVSNDYTTCPNTYGTITFTGTPFGIVNFVSSAGTSHTVVLNAAGTFTWTTSLPLLETVTYTVNNIFIGPPLLCGNPVSDSITITVQQNGCATVIAMDATTGGSIPDLCQPGECFELTTDYTDVRSTTSYEVTQIAYCPQAAFDDPSFTRLFLSQDDSFSGVFSLPFNFCFYGNVFDTLQFGDNGTINFGTNYPGPNAGGQAWAINQAPLSNVNFPGGGGVDNPFRNVIMGVYQDTNTGVPPPAGVVRSLNYAIHGTYPCRKFIVNFDNFALYSCGYNMGVQTYQMVLYEISNIIEVYVKRRHVGSCTWNQGQGVIGIKGGGANPPYLAAPGRDVGTWSAFEEAWRFTPNGPSVTTLEWFEGTTLIGTDRTITVCPTENTTYTARVTYDNCIVNDVIENTITANFLPDNTANPVNLFSIDEFFDITQNTPIILNGEPAGQYDILYYENQIDAQELALNNITNLTNYESDENPKTIYAAISNSATNCIYVRPFLLITGLNPLADDLALCDEVTPGNNFEIFDLTENDANALNGLNPTEFEVSYHNSQAEADSGALPISPADAYNGTNETIYVRVQRIGNPAVYGTTTFTLTINPTPFIADINQTICSEDSFSVTPVTASPDIVPTGTTYTWTVVAPAGITGASDQATPQTTISQTLTNTTDTPINVVYTVTASVGTAPDICTDVFDITVTVNPKPSISNVTPAICSAQTFTVTPSTNGTDIVPVGSTYTWTVVAPSGITGASDQTASQTAISQTLTNSTEVELDVVYTVTVSAGTAPNVCTDTFTITVRVNPLPVINNRVVSICSEDSFTVTPVTMSPEVVPTGTSYTWTVSSPSGITGASAETTGQSSISQSLTNTTNSPLDVIYSVTASVGTSPNICTDTFNITVTVNPTPTVTVNSPTECEGTAATVTATPGIPGSYDYVWNVPSGPNPGNVASFTTTIPGVYSVVITDTVTGCFSTSASGTVTIDPIPTVTVNSPSLCDGAAATVTATPGVAGSYTYAWIYPSGAVDPGDVASFTTIVPGVYSVIITDTVTGCFSASASGTVTINPNPTVTVNSPTECEGTPATVTATPGIPGSYDYVWTVPSGTNPGNVASFTTTIPGVYSVIITDTVTGCFSTSASGTVTINLNPIVSVNSPSVCDGTAATVIATPAVAGSYDYAWTVPVPVANPGNVASFTTTEAGVYSVIITDTATGCFSASASGTVTVNPNPTVSVNSPSVCDGVPATVTATPGVAGSYDYVWTVPSGTNPGNVASFTTTDAGVYSVVITDTATGCFSASASGTVTSNPNPTVTVNSPTECEGTPATVTATPGVAGSYDYVWTVPSGTNPGNVASFTTTIPGIYSVIITDTVTGCFSASASGTVTINLNPVVSVNSPSVCVGTSATVTATPVVAGSYDYAWTVPSGPNPGNVASFTTTIPGVYSVVITDTVTGCFSSGASGTVTINPNPTVTVNSPSVCDGVAATVTATPGVAGSYDYVWTVPSGSNPGNVASFTTTIPGVYSVIITDTVTGCFSVSASGTVTVNPNPTVTVNNPTVCAGDLATLTATAGGTGSYDYTWTVPASATNPGNVASFTTTEAGVYSVIITDTVTGCSSTAATGTVTLVPLPTASISGDTTVCPTGAATITFTATPGSTIEYTIGSGAVQTQDIDTSGIFVITANYSTTTTFSLIGVYTNTIPVCSVPLSQTATITVSPAPTIFTPADLVECDDDNNGRFTFNLLQTENFITGGDTSLIVTYHETYDDAFYGGASIPNPSNYQSEVPWLQTIYVRVINPGAFDCPSVTSFNLIVNPFPVINLTPPAYALCDINSSGDEIFDLPTQIDNILDGLDVGLHTVTFHASETAANDGTPVIASNYLSGTTTVWVRVTINATGCYDVAPLDLIVNPLPIANLPTPLSLCDVNDSGDGREEFDLTQAIAEIVGSQEGLEVSFHFNFAQAQTGELPLSLSYINEVSVFQTLHVRVYDPETTCFSTTTLDLRVLPLPIPTLPLNPVTLCDDNNDGFAVFNLDDLVDGILNGASPSDFSVRFYETYDEASLPGVAITTTANYQGSSQYVYIRMEDLVTGCFTVEMIELKVNPKPQIPDLVMPSKCDANDSNPYNGIGVEFDLTALTPEILAAQTGAASSYQVRYFTSSGAADINVGAIIDPSQFQNTSNPQTIWVRVTDVATQCYDVSSFELNVDVPLQLTTPAPLHVCDELPNDGYAEFDLTSRNNALTNNLGGYIVAFYPSIAQAMNDEDQISNPENYTNIQHQFQSVGVRVTSPAGCHSYITLLIRVVSTPEPLFDPAPIEACDYTNPGDGLEEFDLTERAAYILNGADPTEFVLTYYELLSNAQTETNWIPDPENYTNTTPNQQTIYVRVTRIPNDPTQPRCYQIVELQLIVNPLPAIVSPVSLYQCVAMGDTIEPFILSQADSKVLGTQSAADFTVTYHADAVIAALGTPQLPNSYTSTSVLNTPETIYVRVENNVTGCYIVGTVDLVIEEGTMANPIAADDPAVAKCDDQDDENDGLAEFNLDADVTPILLGTNNYTDTVVYYFVNESDAQTAATENDYSGALSGTDLTNFTTTEPLTQDIYAVLVNPNTQSGCPTIVAVTLTVHKLPEPTVQDDFICTDPQTGDVIREAVLESGLNPTTHEFTWTDSAGNVLGTDENLTVNTPGAYTLTVINTETVQRCSNTVTVNVIQSEQATLSYVQSNYFTDNATITIIATGITIPDQNNTNYVYSLDYGPFQTSNVFTNVSAGSHLVTVQDLNGCQDATIEVFVVDYPKFFTPNGDGHNDTWNIFTLRETNPNAKIYIFDRYGKFLKQIAPAGQGWDGTFNGQNLPSTDYWFTVEYSENGQTKTFKAHFSLKR